MTPLLRDIPYQPDSSRLFAALARRPWAVFLDSGRPAATGGRFDILTAEPTGTLISRGGRTELCTPAGRQVSSHDPLALLAQGLGPRLPIVPGLPFCGGAIGYFGYDLTRRLLPLPEPSGEPEDLPELAVGFYDWALVVDHWRRRSRLVAQEPAALAYWAGLLERASAGSSSQQPGADLRTWGSVRCNFTAAGYRSALARIHDYLLAGDCYQVNLAQRFAVAAEGDGWRAWCWLRRHHPAPFGAYLSLPDALVLSASPERFLQVRGDRVETRPIKGTRPRGSDRTEDQALAADLRRSPKDRAENLMIVDLLRNDLGRVCRIGSIQVPRLFDIESVASVHHLVSTVRGRLAPGRTAVDLLRACFPGGSVTGAPKLRAMQIIDELEPHRRGLYCGAIGYLSRDGGMDSSIAIRTLVVRNGEARLWAGGGIVADSDPDAEYRETLLKAAPLLALLQQLGWRRQD